MPTEIHNHFHGADRRLGQIAAKLDALTTRVEQLAMAIDAQTQGILDRIDAATTTIGNAIVGVADDLRRLAESAEGLTPEELQAFESRLGELEAQGQALVALDAQNIPDV